MFQYCSILYITTINFCSFSANLLDTSIRVSNYLEIVILVLFYQIGMYLSSIQNNCHFQKSLFCFLRILLEINTTCNLPRQYTQDSPRDCKLHISYEFHSVYSVTNFIQLVSLQLVDQFSQTKLHWKAPNKGYLHIYKMYKSNNKQLRYQAINNYKSFISYEWLDRFI